MKPLKKCSSCKKVKSYSEFSKHCSNKDGLQYKCKACVKVYREDNRDMIKEHSKIYVAANKDKKSEYDKTYRLNNYVKIIKNAKIYYANHKKELLENKKLYRSENRESILSHQREFFNTLHGYLYSRWNGINSRCNNSNVRAYPRYGGAGVKNLFKTFDDFFNHVTLDLGLTSVETLKELVIHRISNGNYEVGEVEFISTELHGLRHRELNRRKKF